MQQVDAWVGNLQPLGPVPGSIVPAPNAAPAGSHSFGTDPSMFGGFMTGAAVSSNALPTAAPASSMAGPAIATMPMGSSPASAFGQFFQSAPQIPAQGDAMGASGYSGMTAWPQMVGAQPGLAGGGANPAVPAAFANKPKVPAAFLNRRSAEKALQAREPIELFTGKVMNAWEMMTCQKLEKPVSQTMMASRRETQAMEALHREARGLPSEALPAITNGQSEGSNQQADTPQEGQSQAMQEQMMQQMQMMQQYMLMQQQFAQARASADSAVAAGSEGQTVSKEGEQGAETSEQDTAVFDAIFAAQQAQHMQQMQFVHSMRNQASAPGNLIGSPTGPLVECRFTDDFRPLQYCKRFFSAEGCRRGDKCTYAHCAEELHPNSPEFPKQEMAPGGAVVEPEEIDAVKAMPDMRMKKKREICNKWKKDGGCVLGQSCPFAHGEQEIGTVALVVCEKVKMKVCVFWERGKCVYGKSCINAHGKEEIGLKRPDFMHNAPQGKRRRDGESIEEWRNTVIKGQMF